MDSSSIAQHEVSMMHERPTATGRTHAPTKKPALASIAPEQFYQGQVALACQPMTFGNRHP
jgi:hypothetical protein